MSRLVERERLNQADVTGVIHRLAQPPGTCSHEFGDRESDRLECGASVVQERETALGRRRWRLCRGHDSYHPARRMAPAPHRAVTAFATVAPVAAARVAGLHVPWDGLQRLA
jgi:hypothetical protein